MSEIIYKFKCINETDYRLIFSFIASSKLFNSIFLKAKNKLIKKEKIRFDGNLEYIQSFQIMDDYKPQFLPVLKRAMRKKIREVSKEVREDGIVLVNIDVRDAIYQKKDEDYWLIDVIVGGQYSKR